MKVMILAAGRGERMRPLTDACPKPLLKVGGKSLIVHHLERLAVAGMNDIVINQAHLGEQLVTALGEGSAWGMRIHWSPEPAGALETAGGIANALHLLGPEPFLVINGDIFCDWDVATAPQIAKRLDDTMAHLVMVPNPPQHSQGDFVLDGVRVVDAGDHRLTFSGIGIYRPELFASIVPGTPARLAPLLRHAMADDRVSGECHHGRWEDVGTPQRLAELDEELLRINA